MGNILFNLSETLHSRQLHFLLELGYIFAKQAVGIHQILDGLTGMDYRSMIPSPEMLTDGFQRVFGKCLGQIHRDLPGLHDLPLPGLLEQLIIRQIEIFSYHPLNGFNCNFLTARLNKIS